MFSVNNPDCPITAYTCHEVNSGVLGAACGYSAVSTVLSFDPTTGTVDFHSSDFSDAKYPPGTYTLRITAVAGTVSDVSQSVDVVITLECGLYDTDFIWASHINTAETQTVPRLDYIPGETLPYLTINPLDPANNPVYDNPPACVVKLPITWFRVFKAYDSSGTKIHDSGWSTEIQANLGW